MTGFDHGRESVAVLTSTKTRRSITVRRLHAAHFEHLETKPLHVSVLTATARRSKTELDHVSGPQHSRQQLTTRARCPAAGRAQQPPDPPPQRQQHSLSTTGPHDVRVGHRGAGFGAGTQTRQSRTPAPPTRRPEHWATLDGFTDIAHLLIYISVSVTTTTLCELT